jgi:hypothetical protein
MLAGSATTGQATFEPDDEDEDEEPDELLVGSPLFPLEELEELDDSEPLLLAGESPDFDELSDPLRDLSFSFAPSAAGTVEPLRLSVR